MSESYFDYGFDQTLSRGGGVGDSSLPNGITNQVTSSTIISSMESGEYNGNFILGKDGYIRGGAEGYDSGVGFFLGWDSTIHKFFIGNSAGDKLTWDGSTLSVTGTINVIAGSLAGLTISSTALTATSGGNTTIVSSGATAFTAGPTGSPTFTVTQAGLMTTNSANIGGWNVISGYIYNLASGTPTASPNDGIVLASGNEALIVYEGTAERVRVGYISAGVYGLKGYATDGSTVIFELSDTRQYIAGLALTGTTLEATNLTVTSGAANVANIAVGTGSNLAGMNSGNGATDVAFWAGDTYANRATAPFRILLNGNTTVGTLTVTSLDSGALSIGGVAVTSSAAELNILDGVTATATELNYLDIASLGTGAASKAVVLDSGEDYIWPATGLLTYGGTAITASGAELNTMDGITATTAQLNEAGTFFGATDITGAEAETLTDDSNADSLHTHDSFTLLQASNAGSYIQMSLPTIYGNGDTSWVWRVTQGGGISRADKYAGGVKMLLTSGANTGTGGMITVTNDNGTNTISNAPPVPSLLVTDRQYWMYNVYTLNSSGYDLWFGFTSDNSDPNTPVAGDDYAAFHFDDGTWKCESSDGAVVESTTISVTNAQINSFVIWKDSSSVKFYVNNTIVATHSTRVPDSASDSYGFVFGSGNTSGADGGAVIFSPVTVAVHRTDYNPTSL